MVPQRSAVRLYPIYGVSPKTVQDVVVTLIVEPRAALGNIEVHLDWPAYNESLPPHDEYLTMLRRLAQHLLAYADAYEDARAWDAGVDWED